MFLALRAGLRYDLFGLCAIFLPQRDLVRHVFNQRKHAYLTHSSDITAALSAFLSRDPVHTMDFYRFKKSWKGLPGRARIQAMTSDTQDHPLHGSPPPLPRSKVTHMRWADDFHQAATDHPGAPIASCTTPTSPSLPPFIKGAIKVGNHRYSSAAFQITLCHTFHGWYSTRFHQGADDETHCHCPRGPPHSAKHILTECPLFTHHRRLFFSNHSYQWIFSTEQGGHALTQFLHYTQQLLWPLPPRPDPP